MSKSQPRFRVCIQKRNGRKTKGRYYVTGPRAWNRAKHLRSMLTKDYQVLIINIRQKVVVSSGTGWWPSHGMRMFKPETMMKK